jgi:hypothetical protein
MNVVRTVSTPNSSHWEARISDSVRFQITVSLLVFGIGRRVCHQRQPVDVTLLRKEPPRAIMLVNDD